MGLGAAWTGIPPGARAASFLDDGAGGEVIEALVRELRHGRRGVVFDEVVLDDGEAGSAAVGLEAHDVSFEGDAVDLGLGVVDLDLDGLGAGRRGTEVRRAVVGDADEVKAVVGDVEGEATLLVGLGAGGLRMPCWRRMRTTSSPAGGLVGGLVGDDAGEGVGQGDGREGEAQRSRIEDLESTA